MSGTLFSIIESPSHPNLSDVYARLGLEQIQLTSIRKAIGALKKHRPDVVVAEFFYAYGTNYSGIHKSNLDMLFITLEKYDARPLMVVIAQKEEKSFMQDFQARFPVELVYYHPVDKKRLEQDLRDRLSK